MKRSRYKRAVKLFGVAFVLLACSAMLCAWYLRIIGTLISPDTDTVNANMLFRVWDSQSGNRLEGVAIVLIDYQGRVVDVLTTDPHGEVEKTISVPIDHKYYNRDNQYISPRGTLTAIAYKSGYVDTVLYETPACNYGPVNPVPMMRRTPEIREDHIEVLLGNNHHHAVSFMVEKYGVFAGK